MSERDAMALLAAASPVRLEDIPQLDLTVDSILARRRRPTRRLVLAVAVVAAAAAASLLGVFVFGGGSSHPVVVRRGLSGSPTLARPLPPPIAKQVSLPDAAATLGATIVMPDTSLVGPSDAGPVWLQDERPHFADVAVTFPGPKLIVYYLRPIQYPEPVPTMYQTEARQNPASMSAIDLDGVPALATAQNSDQLGTNFGSIEFVVDGTQVSVLGHYDEATLQAVAQSIVDRTHASTGSHSGINLLPILQPRTRIPLRKASMTFGAPFVLPARSLVRPSDVRRVWTQGTCPPISRPPRCLVWVRFSSLTLVYERPSPWRPSFYRQLARKSLHFKVIRVNGLPALEIPRNIDGRNPGSIDFVVNGVRIVVVGDRDSAALVTVAQSIVDRTQ